MATGTSIQQIEEPASEFGVTVKDAERLLRRAKFCHVFFRTGPDAGNSEVLSVSKSVMLRMLRTCCSANAMPCELYTGGTADPVIIFGGVASIEKAAEARR